MTITSNTAQSNFRPLFTFLAITLFYTFEAAQMAYYNVLAPTYISLGLYHQHDVAAISAAYFYGTMAGLFPMGYLLDHFCLRKIILLGLLGSVAGIVLLISSDSFSMQWIARFICGFFGGTTCFLGGIRIIALTYPKRFSYFMGVFLAAGMFGGMICQYPLLIAVKHFGLDGALHAVLITSILALVFNFIFLRPNKQHLNKQSSQDENKNNTVVKRTPWQTFKIIVFTPKNWCDVVMVSLLDTPVSIIGTLWGIIFITQFFHFTEVVGSLIIMSLFLGLMIGLPVIGHIADNKNNPPSIIVWGGLISLLAVIAIAMLQTTNLAWLVALLFFILGFFSSCQTMGFTWITKGFQPDLIGRNSAFNSMIFMGVNGLFKQIGAFLLVTPSMFIGDGSAANLMLALAVGMIIAVLYACVRKIIFKKSLQQTMVSK